jgi:succinate dehydrogenase / fumarate reductase cytochrome b subunit
VRVTHGAEAYPTTILADGTQVRDVHSMIALGFQNPVIAIFYLLSVGLLSFHLAHGLVSMFQSLGLRTRTWSRFLEKVTIVVCVLYFLGNAVIVVACYCEWGNARIQNPQIAGFACRTDCEVCGARTADAIADVIDGSEESQS